MTPINFCVYVAFSDAAAMQFGHALPFDCNKKRGWYIKEYGKSKRFSRRRYPHTDEPKKRRKKAPPPDEPIAEPLIALPAPKATAHPTAQQQMTMWDDETWKARQKKRRL